MKLCLPLVLAFLQLSFSQHASALVVRNLIRQSTGQPPVLLKSGNSFFIGHNSSGTGIVQEFRRINSDYRSVWIWPVGANLITQIARDKFGWLAACSQTGQALHYTNPIRRVSGVISFDKVDRNCAGMTIVDGKERLPNFWIGAVGTREVLRINSRGRVLRKFPEVSGLFNLKLIDGIFFSLNESTSSSAFSSPVIFKEDTGDTLAGSKAGNHSTHSLGVGYASNMLDDSEVSGSVFYFNELRNEIVSFPAKNPSETNLTITPTSLLYPRAMARHNRCLVLMGSRAVPYERDIRARVETAFAVYKLDSHGQLQEVFAPYLPDTSGKLHHGRSFEIGDNGEAVVTQLSGVVLVNGILDGVDCSY